MLFAAVHESVIGTKRTCACAVHMSAFGGKVDINAGCCWDAAYPKVLALQRELLAVAGWPHCRAAYEENLREAEEWRDYRVLLVRDPDARHQGTGMDEASLRERLKEAREEVAYRKKLLADLGAE